MFRYALAVFISAFLLFQVQPMVGKYILPWFGGTPAVWTTCMLFFQVLLLAGYAYAHLAVSRLPQRRQGVLHLVLLVAALAVLIPMFPPGSSWKPRGDENPIWSIFLLLLVSIGLPYLLLSSTSPLLQGWFARSYPGRSPYRLFALSNFGSLLALVTYPLAFEPLLQLLTQANVWSVGFFLFVVACGWCAMTLFEPSQRELDESTAASDGSNDADADNNDEVSVAAKLAGAVEKDPAALLKNNPFGKMVKGLPEQRPVPEGPPSVSDMVLWLLLSACGSVMLLATTNQMCTDVAVVPFLWVLPLALYLITFVICFESDEWYARGWFGIATAVAVAQAWLALHYGVNVPIKMQVAVFSVTLFACCMSCHGELALLKPNPRHVTLYYLMISLGGALGGLFVAVVAPYIFKGIWEYHLGLALTLLLLLVCSFRDRTWVLYGGRPYWAWAILMVVFASLVTAFVYQIYDTQKDAIATGRNFFGALLIEEHDKYDKKGNVIPDDHYLSLQHGRILHGIQFTDPVKSRWPTSYYARDSGVGLSILEHPRRSESEAAKRTLSIGVVGLGTGTIAALGMPGDKIQFYEINPLVVELNERYFTYVRDSDATVSRTMGDARISMERETAAGETDRFDVLAVDAFSSDAIPVHLLTRECAEVYFDILKPDGILAIHVSNRYLTLEHVVLGLAQEFKQQAIRIHSKGNDDVGTDTATWVLVTNNQAFLNHMQAVGIGTDLFDDEDYHPVLWTDSYSNLLSVMFDPE